MQQSSSSIGTLATALAKAQTELVNPEKSLTATVRSDETGGAEQIFRYAPLSSGLEILRKTLGQHEIAILQATAIDQATSCRAMPDSRPRTCEICRQTALSRLWPRSLRSTSSALCPAER